MGLFLNTKGGPDAIDASKTLDVAKHVKFEVLETIDDIDVPFNFFILNDTDNLEHLTMTFDAYRVNTGFIYGLHMDEAYFDEYQVIVFHLNYASSDGNPKVAFVDNCGSHIELITTSKNSKNAFHSFDFNHRIFVIRVKQEDVKDLDIYRHKVKYSK